MQEILKQSLGITVQNIASKLSLTYSSYEQIKQSIFKIYDDKGNDILGNPT